MSNNMIANRYEVFQHIGQGGMSDVFLAVDTILNRQAAIKILRSELCTDAVSVLRFEREAQAATALSHPNIVEIYDVGEYKGHHYIVMEYVPGKTLKKIVRDRGALPNNEAIDIMKQLTSAVSEAHRKGIIHRDIKPQNIIVKADGSIKILDFGIALAKGSMQLTQANNVMGSVHYLAPELAKGESATAQSDIYALGIVLFEMLTGDVPYKAETAVQVALMQMRNTMPDVKSLNPAVPQSLANIVIKATAKDKENRYRSANEMLEDLRTCLLPEKQNEPKLILKTIVRPKPVPQPASSQKTSGARPIKPQPVQETTSTQRVAKPAVQKKPKKRLRNRVLGGVLILLLTLLAVSGIYFALNLSGILKPHSRYVETPELIGMTMTEAKNTCTDMDLVLDTTNVIYTLTSDTEKGKIISTEPVSGESVEKGTKITVTVSSGIYEIADNFVGQNINAVKEMIENPSTDEQRTKYKNLVLTANEVESDNAKPGEIISQELLTPGAQYNPTTKNEIRLVYAAYPTIVIPGNLEGMAIEEAVATLEGMGAKVFTSNLSLDGLTENEVDNLTYGVVIKTDPDLGNEYTQKEDNYITVYYY